MDLNRPDGNRTTPSTRQLRRRALALTATRPRSSGYAHAAVDTTYRERVAVTLCGYRAAAERAVSAAAPCHLIARAVLVTLFG